MIAAKAFETAGGTESGNLIDMSFNINLQNIMVATKPMIIAVKKKLITKLFNGSQPQPPTDKPVSVADLPVSADPALIAVITSAGIAVSKELEKAYVIPLM